VSCVIDNNPRDPKKMLVYCYFQVMFDVATKGNVWVICAYNAVAAIDISESLSIQILRRIEESFPEAKSSNDHQTEWKPEHDASKGHIINWIKMDNLLI
jgi:hypothetical protein